MAKKIYPEILQENVYKPQFYLKNLSKFIPEIPIYPNFI